MLNPNIVQYLMPMLMYISVAHTRIHIHIRIHIDHPYPYHYLFWYSTPKIMPTNMQSLSSSSQTCYFPYFPTQREVASVRFTAPYQEVFLNEVLQSKTEGKEQTTNCPVCFE